MWTIVIIIVILVILGVIVSPLLLVLSFFFAFKPDSPEKQLKEFGANLLGYEFGKGGYEVLESKSQNNHPDRPQDLKIKLSDDEFNRLKAYIDTLSEGEERNKKDGNAYVRTIKRYEDGCTFKHNSIHIGYDFPFFIASAEIDYHAKTVTFGSSLI